MSSADDALAAIGRDDATRLRILAALQDYERLPEHRFTTVRDDVTGPIVDALHASVATVTKELRNGLRFEFLYRSKIARDFVMSVPAVPDHVWEPQTTKLLLHLAREAGHVVVGGAYFGDQAIPVAHALRGRGVCHAFEPDRDQAAMLARNAAMNGLTNVGVDERALWSDSASRLSFVGEDAVARTVASAEGLPTVALDDYAEAEGISVSLIMLDLEGSEFEVLRGAERQLRRSRPSVVFEVHRLYVDWTNGLQETEIVRFLASLGYTCFAVRDFQSNFDLAGRPIELVPVESAWLEGPPHGFNVVAVPDPDAFSGDGFAIVPGVSPKLLLHRDPALHHPTGGL